jgi:hypothetical protein
MIIAENFSNSRELQKTRVVNCVGREKFHKERRDQEEARWRPKADVS